MGIFDGVFNNPSQHAQESYEYDEHLRKLKMEYALFNQQMRAEVARGMMNANVVGQGVYNTGVIAGAQTQKESFNPNKNEAYQIPLSQLVTMWRIKYGDEWVDTAQPHDDSFYAHACTRLSNNDMFESARCWVRLKEDLA